MNQILVPQPEQRRPFGDKTALRDTLMSADLNGLKAANKSLPGADRECRLLAGAVRQLREGRSFDFGHLDLNSEAFHACFCETGTAAMAAMAEGALGLPYEVFTSLTRLSIPGAAFDGFVLFAVEADGDRTLHFFPVTPMVNELGGIDFVPFPCSGRATFLDGGGIWLEPAAYSRKDDRVVLDVMLQLVFFQLGRLADNRVPLVRETAPAKLDRARALRGRPRIPSRWKVDAKSWVTKLSGQQKGPVGGHGGRHRSPVAHDRRGHQRRLASGRMTWVKASRVGELTRRLTRHRKFYELATGDGQ